MAERWSQRSAWIVWVPASLAGWVAIATIVLQPFGGDNPSVAESPPAEETTDMAPATGTDDEQR